MPKSDEKDFFKRARKIVDAIRKDSKGKRCGDCCFYRGSYCGFDWDNWEKDIVIETPDAVACPHWEART